MPGLRKYPAQIEADPDWNNLVDYLGGVTSEAQITGLKVLLFSGGSPMADASGNINLQGKALQDALLAQFQNQASAPATPASGKVRLYSKTDKKLYYKDDAGLETGPLGAGGGGAAGWQNCIAYPFAGTAVLSADPFYSYTAEVSESSGSYTEVAWFDFDLPVGTIKSIFANLVWAQKITGSGNGYVKWQVASGSHASPGTYVDITDEVAETGTGYIDHARSGVINQITGITTATPFTIRCLVKKGTATSAQAKVKSNTYLRVTYKVT